MDSHDLASLSPAKRLLLEKLLLQRAPSPSPEADPLPRAEGDTAPLTSEQRRLWFLHRLSPGAAAYTIPRAFRLRGRLDAAALERALAALVRRHEALRTVFREEGGEPLQTVRAEMPFTLERVDARGAPDPEGEAARAVGQLLRKKFDPERGPLFRARLVRVGDHDHVLATATHHLVSDGWSEGILYRELGALYAAFARGDTPALPPPPARFVDFAAWERAEERRAATADAVAWFAKELEGAPRVLEVPTDRPRPATQSFAGAKRPFALTPAARDALRAAARAEGTTPFAVLVAAVAAVLSRHAGQDDLVIGMATANRARPEVEHVVGFFANTLPLRMRLDDDPSARELVRRAHAAVRGAEARVGTPFDRLVEAAAVRRDPARPPLVQVLVGYTAVEGEVLALPEMEVTPYPADSGASGFDLGFVAEDGPAGVHGEAQYASDLYDAETIDRLVRHLSAAVEAIAARPGLPVSAIELTDAEERRRAVFSFNRAPAEAEPECVHRLFEAQVRATPDAVAVAHGGARVTYAELNRRANRVARHLQKLGAGPEHRVGVLLERTPSLLAALLGVMKAGAAAVPLDLANPPARVEAILRAADARLAVTQSALRATLPDHVAALEMETVDASIGGEEDPSSSVCPQNLAYLIFTSGSTGGPKGVQVEHRSAAAFLRFFRGLTTERERAGMLAATTVAFDASVAELFGALCWGGTVILVDNLLADIPAEPPVRITELVPTAAAELLRAGRLPRTLETVLLGGEPVPAAVARALFAAGVGRVVNVYGPTEDTVYSTAGEMAPDVERVSIGRPIDGGRVYVLDARLRPAPIGAPGEIFAAGAGVARGYAGRPALTAEAFVPDPFAATPGARMYRTGDLGRHRSDGTLEHLGRRDAQVKVRGFRIEPGEVEQVLAAHPAVREAAVAAEGAGEDARLVAYLAGGDAADGDGRPSPADLRAFARGRLPEYMVPSTFAWLPALPRMVSGKLDRRALRLPADAAPAAEASRFVEPRTGVEKGLAAAWREVLAVERVGVHDDFFLLGGHSLLALRLAARVRETMGIDLPVATLLRSPTIGALAEALAEDASAGVHLPLVPLQPLGTEPPLFVMHAGGGHVVVYRTLAQLLGPERPVYALQARGLDDGLAPLESTEEMADYYLDAILSLRPEGPYHLAGWSFGGMLAFEMARRLETRGKVVGVVALLDTAYPPEPDRLGDTLDHSRVLVRIISDVGGWAASSRVKVERIRHLPHDAQVTEALRMADTPKLGLAARREEIVTLTRVRRANLHAMAGYRPAPYAGSIAYFRTAGSEQRVPPDPSLDYWGALAMGGATLVRVPGNHGSILYQPHVHVVALRLKEAMEGRLVDAGAAVAAAAG